MRVGLFDSGIGGLTVLKELINKYPLNQYVYYGDTLNLPYGSKTKEELFNLSSRIIKFLENEKVDIIIIACGTISSNIYEELKQATSIPLYSIIEPTINYLKVRKYRNIAVLATSTTVNSGIFKKKLENVNVIEIECPLLVPLIESNDENKIETTVVDYLSKIDMKIDALVLGCTHYQLIENIIKKHVHTEIINMGKILYN
ncbi:MAG: glutamate racemase [Bacilli bacterium]